MKIKIEQKEDHTFKIKVKKMGVTYAKDLDDIAVAIRELEESLKKVKKILDFKYATKEK